MDAKELKLECLRLSCESNSKDDKLKLAEAFYRFIASNDECGEDVIVPASS